MFPSTSQLMIILEPIMYYCFLDREEELSKFGGSPFDQIKYKFKKCMAPSIHSVIKGFTVAQRLVPVTKLNPQKRQVKAPKKKYVLMLYQQSTTLVL